MTSLESVLREVEPILQGRNFTQFTHPSFQEVLAARQLAHEINSKRLSVRNAYINLWSEPLFESYRRVMPDWRSSLTHLSTMLSDLAASEFINVVSENRTLIDVKAPSFSEFSVDCDVVYDLKISARCIGEHPALHDSEIVKNIIDILFHVATSGCGSRDVYSTLVDESYGYGSHSMIGAVRALRLTKSERVAAKYAEGMHEFVYAGGVSRTDVPSMVCDLAQRGVKIPEDILLKGQGDRILLSHKREHIVEFLGEYGGKASLEALTARLSNDQMFAKYLCRDNLLAKERCYDHFRSMLRIVKRHEFDPDLIELFNNLITGTIGKIPDSIHYQSGKYAEALMSVYHQALSNVAKDFKEESATELYSHLETKGVQFLDSWVYKPK